MDFFLPHWMDEPYLVCVKAYSAVRIGAWRAVFQVALDAAAEMAELAADLVVASGKQLDFDEMVALGAV